MVVHETPQYIVVDESPPPPLQPNAVGPVSPRPSARQPAYMDHANGIPYLIRPSRGGGSGGGEIPLVGGRLHLLLRAPHPHLALPNLALRTQNLELQRSQQELSQAVASTAGISQSYGDRMTQILSPLAKFDAVVQGYQRESKAVEASVSDHLKMSNSNTAKCVSTVETLATRYAAVASRIDAWDHWYSTPAEPVAVVVPAPSAPPPVSDPEPAAPTAPMGAPSGPSGRGCVLPSSVHPSQDYIYHPNACPDSGWPRGGEENHEHPHHQEPTSWRGTAQKRKERAIPEWRAAPKGEEHPTEPTAPWANAHENTSSLVNINPLTKNVFTSPGKPSYTPSHPTSFSSEGCAKCKWTCTPNHGSPRLPPVPNAYGAK